MVDDLNRLFRAHREPIYLLLQGLTTPGKSFLVWHEVRSVIARWRETEAGTSVSDSELAWLELVQEAVVATPAGASAAPAVAATSAADGKPVP